MYQLAEIFNALASNIYFFFWGRDIMSDNQKAYVCNPDDGPNTRDLRTGFSTDNQHNDYVARPTMPRLVLRRLSKSAAFRSPDGLLASKVSSLFP
jgi:hypothetical protein